MQLSKQLLSIFKKLNSPAKIQDYINDLPFNFEKNGDTIYCPNDVVIMQTAHCLEGALFASAVLNFHKIENYLLDLKCKKKVGDFDHVVCIFKIGKFFGAISKTNHNVLRYREPVYLSWREIAMSFYHEYFLDNGKKTLESFSIPLSTLTIKKDWVNDEDGLWYVSKKLDKIKHIKIVPKSYEHKLRNADQIEIDAGKITEYKK